MANHGSREELRQRYPMPTEVPDIVRSVLVEALALDDETITPGASIILDLGAESIDFLDIVFKLERGLNINIPRNRLFPDELTVDSQYTDPGNPALFNPAGVAAITELLWFTDFPDTFAAHPDQSRVGDFLTVGGMCRLLSRLQDEQREVPLLS